ncbi:MAG: 3-deoxy-D-manno-octulosonic acid transferase [Candidatus Omnitrophica bacterium]|nr:3-deoxy-D-manno-octulosonic acid transferase [Candidatus Omnitrophota bacterium]MBL7210675.1 3-deoxy-D-manno-octulosonic acid transferase [Candidatus Omnitrophota bacterium]
MFIIYDLIFLIFALVSLPAYLFRRRFHRGFARRLGILPPGLKLERPIWIHAVSVGEAVTIKGLVEELRKIFPGKRFVISTVTPTGNKIAVRIAGEGDFVTYLPFDLSFIVKKLIKRINPALFVIAETEIWPNLICALHAARVAVVTVNGRISDGSLKGYLAIKFLLKPILDKVSLFCMQSERDAARLSRLGVAQDKIKITGNMKFDAAGFRMEAAQLIRCRQALGLGHSDKLLVCGSTHRHEEEALLQVYSRLAQAFSGLKLLIAPRHPERAGEIEGLIVKYGFKPMMLSRLDQQASSIQAPKAVFILDSVGQLVNYYAVADIVFVGGSLVNKGGHNILEPAFLEKPILFGPYMSNFHDIACLFMKTDAAIAVANQGELEKNIEGLLSDPRRCLELGSRARGVLLQNQGATIRNAQNLAQFCGIIE